MCAPHSQPQLSSHYDHTEGYNRVCVCWGGVLPLWDFCRFLFDFLVLTSANTQMLPVELSWTRLLNCVSAHVSVCVHVYTEIYSQAPHQVHPSTSYPGIYPLFYILAIFKSTYPGGDNELPGWEQLAFSKTIKIFEVRNSAPRPHKRTYTFNQRPLLFFFFF